MPQMAPLNWLTLMLTFITIMILFNIINHYSFLYQMKSKTLKTMKKYSINWKW